MHIAEGILPLEYALIGFAAATPALAIGWRGIASGTADDRRQHRTVASMATALIFVATFLPIPVPTTGITSHICATPLLALVFGLRLVIIPSMLTLLVQALFLGHGGITSLGVNLITLGVIGPVVGYGFARILRAMRLPSLAAVFFACALGDIAVYVADAVLIGMALGPNDAFRSTFFAVLMGFLPVQLPLALLEGAISAVAIRFLMRRRAHLVPGWIRSPSTAAWPVIFMLVGGCLGLSCGPKLQGADEAVIDTIARQVGHPAQPWFDPGSEQVLAGACVGCFFAGLVVGRYWTRSEKSSHDR